MSRTPRVTGHDLIAALGKGGFRVLRGKGAHSGETIGPGLLHKILRDCKLTVGELAEFLQQR
jgi:predicted RNA binding protein YcfA (HicA-like mRNA interferase family)